MKNILLTGMALSMPVIGLSAQTFRDSVELEQVVVTATHSPKALKDAPVVTRLITLHDIKITDATNIQDLLTQVPRRWGTDGWRDDGQHGLQPHEP